MDKFPKASKETVLAYVADLVGELLWYGRKGDDEVPRGAIENLIGAGKVTIDEMVERFRRTLEYALK